MAEAGYHGDRAEAHRAHDGFFVEDVEVVAVSAAAHEHEARKAADAPRALEGRRNFLGRAYALHEAGDYDYLGARVAQGVKLEHVLERRAGRRGYDGDALGIARQRAFEAEIEYPLAFKLHAQRLFRTRLRPRAEREQTHGVYLVRAARAVDVDLAAHEHLVAVLRPDEHGARVGAEEHARDARIFSEQSKICVAAGVQFEAQQFAAHGKILKRRFAEESLLDGGRHLVDRDYFIVCYHPNRALCGRARR